jgi:hypothetical protein
MSRLASKRETMAQSASTLRKKAAIRLIKTPKIAAEHRNKAQRQAKPSCRFGTHLQPPEPSGPGLPVSDAAKLCQVPSHLHTLPAWPALAWSGLLSTTDSSIFPPRHGRGWAPTYSSLPLQPSPVHLLQRDAHDIPRSPCRHPGLHAPVQAPNLSHSLCSRPTTGLPSHLAGAAAL